MKGSPHVIAFTTTLAQHHLGMIGSHVVMPSGFALWCAAEGCGRWCCMAEGVIAMGASGCGSMVPEVLRAPKGATVDASHLGGAMVSGRP